MDFIKDAKEGTCPQCGGSLKKSIVNDDDGIDIKVKSCEACDWRK